MGHLRRLIVFDLDGTLVDSRRDLAASANALIEERGGRPLPEAAIARWSAKGAALLVRRALTAAGLRSDESVYPLPRAVRRAARGDDAGRIPGWSRRCARWPPWPRWPS
jgi:phosphoglycolate phosphatase-like HAD superfamily hydrolase